MSFDNRVKSVTVISSSTTSRVMLPWCTELLMCWPAIPTLTTLISIPDCSLASAIAFSMAITVLSILVTIPRITPSETALPIPNTSSFPYSFFVPTITQIFVVPMSSPTTILSSCMALFVFYISELQCL